MAIPVQRARGPERAYLMVLAGPQLGSMFRLDLTREVVLGRDESGAQIVISDDSVSVVMPLVIGC
jgi:hypothetical protein